MIRGMLRFLLSFGLLMVTGSFSILPGATVEELQALAAKVNPDGGEVTVQFEPDKKILKFGRKIQVNPQRHIIQTQAVALKFLEPEAGLDSIGSRFQPWVKLRCRNDKKEVLITEQVFVDEEEIDLESTEEYHAVMVIPCDVYELEGFANALTLFIEQNR